MTNHILRWRDRKQTEKRRKRRNEKRERQAWGEKRDFGELKLRAADSVKACDLSIRQHFLRANIVVIADQAQCLTFILIAIDDRMSSAQADSPGSPTCKNQQATIICLRLSPKQHKLSINYSAHHTGIYIATPILINFHCHKDLNPPSCFWKIPPASWDACCRSGSQMTISWNLVHRDWYRTTKYVWIFFLWLMVLLWLYSQHLLSSPIQHTVCVHTVLYKVHYTSDFQPVTCSPKGTPCWHTNRITIQCWSYVYLL